MLSRLRILSLLVHIFMNCNEVRDVTASIMAFNQACQNLWAQDSNRVSFGRHYQVDIQGRILDASSNIDEANLPFFPYVDTDILKRPTYKSFIALLDNYYSHVGKTEDVTSIEKQESWTFLNEISTTGPIKELHKYLVNEGLADASMDKFLGEMYKVWFYRYRRMSYRDSSGFEHVFVGEISRGAVSGFHNWLQFYILERDGKLDYRGFMKYYGNQPSRVKLQLFWGNYKKKVTSLFLGTSPEFDFAIYTLCFLANPGKSCQCTINGQSIPIVTYDFKGGNYIGTAYLRL